MDKLGLSRLGMYVLLIVLWCAFSAAEKADETIDGALETPPPAAGFGPFGGPGGVMWQQLGRPSKTAVASADGAVNGVEETAPPSPIFGSPADVIEVQAGGPPNKDPGVGQEQPTASRSLLAYVDADGQTRQAWVSAPMGTPIFPYDQTMRTSVVPTTAAAGSITTAPTPGVAPTTTEKTLSAAGAMESLMSSLNVTVSSQHLAALPTANPEFQAAIPDVIKLLDGRRMVHYPLELEVSPGHMYAVYETTKRLEHIRGQFQGTPQDRLMIYDVWTGFLDALVSPPREEVDPRIDMKDNYKKAWKGLYGAYYMARVVSEKVRLQRTHRTQGHEQGGILAKSYNALWTSWSISAQNLSEVDQLNGHSTNRPGHGLHKKMKACGGLSDWKFVYGDEEVLDCPSGSRPYGMKKKKGQGGKTKKPKGKSRKEKVYDTITGQLGVKPSKPISFSDLGKDINATEPIPPEVDDVDMTWWAEQGGSGCRPDNEQAPRQNDTYLLYGDEVSHKPGSDHKPCKSLSDKHAKPYDWFTHGTALNDCPAIPKPQDWLVKRDGVLYLHINYYLWYQNANVRLTQLQGDRLRKDSGFFHASFNLPVGMEDCVKKKLYSMGWQEEIDVENHTEWVGFIFDFLMTFAVPVAFLAV